MMKKCKTCDNFTDNESGICDNCLRDKYNLWDKRKYRVTDVDYLYPLISEDDVLEIIDKLEKEMGKEDEKISQSKH